MVNLVENHIESYTLILGRVCRSFRIDRVSAKISLRLRIRGEQEQRQRLCGIKDARCKRFVFECDNGYAIPEIDYAIPEIELEWLNRVCSAVR